MNRRAFLGTAAASLAAARAALAEPTDGGAVAQGPWRSRGSREACLDEASLWRTAAARRRASAFKDSISSRRPTGRS